MTTHTPPDVASAIRADNLITWLELEAVNLGTASQRERLIAGVLPEDELTALARTELFKGFGEFRRFAGRDRTALMFSLKHEGPKGQCAVNQETIDLETADVTELGADEWAILKRIQGMVEAMKDHPWIHRAACQVDVVSSTHWATCRTCKAETCCSSVKVTVHWAGRELTREYALWQS